MGFNQKEYQRKYLPEWRKRNSEKEKQYWKNYSNGAYQLYMQTEKYKESKLRTRLKSRYGITLEQYNAMLEAQNGVCALCGKPPREGDRLCVDHDKDTATVRKLLCRLCNVGLGNLGHNPELLRRAAIYLEDYSQ